MARLRRALPVSAHDAAHGASISRRRRAPFRMQPGLRRLAPGSSAVDAVSARATARCARSSRCSSAHRRALRCCARASTPRPRCRRWPRRPRRNILTPSLGRRSRHVCACARLVGGGDVSRCSDGAPARDRRMPARLPPPWRLAGLLSLASPRTSPSIDGADAHIPWLAVACRRTGRRATRSAGTSPRCMRRSPTTRRCWPRPTHLARLVTGRDRWERFVWTHHRRPASATGTRSAIAAVGWNPALDAAALAASAFLRTEHQTFIPVPERRQAVFTIHVDVEPLRSAMASVCRGAAAARCAVDDESGRAGLPRPGAARDRLLAWLERRGGVTDARSRARCCSESGVRRWAGRKPSRPRHRAGACRLSGGLGGLAASIPGDASGSTSSRSGHRFSNPHRCPQRLRMPHCRRCFPGPVPPPTPDLHRLAFDEGRVQLLIGPVDAALDAARTSSRPSMPS